MKEVEDSLDNIGEAKKFSLGHKITALQQLILLRYQALTTISGIGFAVVGVFISVRGDVIHNWTLTLSSFTLLIFISLTSLGRYLYLLRDDINGITRKIRELPKEDWSKPLKEKGFAADFWPESLYILLIIGVLLFIFSLL